MLKRLTGKAQLERRIMDMGITRGCEIFVRKVAPFGDPIEIKFVDMSYHFVRKMQK